MKLFTKLKQIFCIHELVMLPGYDIYLNPVDKYENKLSREYVLECKKCGCRIVMIKRWTTIDEDILDKVHTKLRVYKSPDISSDSDEMNNKEIELHDIEVCNINEVNKNNRQYTIDKKANMYSNLYDIDKEKFNNANYNEVELVVLREFLRGERYILDYEKIKTETEENKYKYEIGYNRAIEKAIKMIDELSDNKFKHLSELPLGESND